MFFKDAQNMKIAVLKKEVAHSAWKLIDGGADLEYPTQPPNGVEAYTSAGLVKSKDIDWSELPADQCWVTTWYTHIEFNVLETDYAPLFLKITQMPQPFLNPKKKAQDCPIPAPYVARPVKYICDSLM